MPKPQPKKHFQIQRLFGLAKEPARLACWDPKDHLEAIAETVTNGRVTSLSELTFDEANAMIVRLGGTAFSLRSKRTENYRKQQAGIKTIETGAHLKKIEEYAAKLGWNEDRLRGFCQRQVKKDVPTTTEEGNKVLEGLKAMARRLDNVTEFPGANAQNQKPKTAAPRQSFRRVA